MIRVVLPYHLRNLAHINSEVQLEISGHITINAILNSLEARYPMLAGTIRDHVNKQRRPFVRYYVCGEDISLEQPDAQLPPQILSGKEPFVILGAIAGG
ncbi:MAG: MoaD/ThiS family protein [Bacteroidia bacterium]|nr:MoaD/ThiS family protein [Bacteroidia bacterium]